MSIVVVRFMFRYLFCVWVLVSCSTVSVAQEEESVFSEEEALSPAELRNSQQSPAHPETAYWNITVTMTLTQPGPGSHVQMLLPLSDGRQSVLARRASAAGASYREEADGLNLWGHWRLSDGDKSPRQLAYEYTVQIADAHVTLPQEPFPSRPVRGEERKYLSPSFHIQSDAEPMKAQARRLSRGKKTGERVVRALYAFVAALPDASDRESAGDAMEVLTKKEGGRAGKTRALVALLRAVGIPARIVGGIRLGDLPEKRTTISWVEALLGSTWIPMDPGDGYFAWLPNTYLALYRNDLPLLVHTRRVPVEYAFSIRRVTRGEVLAEDQPEVPRQGAPRRESVYEFEHARTVAAYVNHPLANVVFINDGELAREESEKILAAARESQINVTLVGANFVKNHFREHYLQLLFRDHLPLLREADLVLIRAKDIIDFYALLKQGETGVSLDSSRVVIAGEFPWSVGKTLGAVLQRLIHPQELVLVREKANPMALWELARAYVHEGTPLAASAARSDAQVASVTEESLERLNWWRRQVVDVWAFAVRSLIPLSALNLLLVLPLIAFFLVIIRNVIGLETFGTFSPMLLSLAFLTTGLWWGFAVFTIIVGLGTVLRFILQRLRLHLVSRVAILIAVVAVSMVGLIVLGAAFGIGALLHASIFPMVIMANTIENFANTQMERGTGEALRLTRNTLLVATCSYLGIEETGLKPLVLTFPEILLGVIGVELLLGRWRGLRLLEYVRFYGLLYEERSASGDETRKASVG